MPTIAELIRARADDASTALAFEDRRWSYAEFVASCRQRAALLASMGRNGPVHVGVLLDNVPEFPMWLGAAAVAGAVVVGINPTRRGAELARDITHTNCRLIVTESAHRPLLEDVDLGATVERVLDVDSPEYAASVAEHAGADWPDVEVTDGDLYLLLFTSGTSGAPKAVMCSQGRLARISEAVDGLFNLTADDVCYQAMPLFHSNALMAGWGPALAAGATSALRRKFSASGFLGDVRAFGATYFNYVGRPLSYILATPELPDDADNPLVRVFGNEGNDSDLERFSRRFGCTVTDGYGSTEGGATVSRTADMPAGALGRGTPGTVVLDADTGLECPPARFDDLGRLLNAEEAVGELVNKLGASAFEGYWNNDDATQARLREGFYWTGDLAYRDEAGFIYFAGRDFEWVRVDGENFAAAPVERILARHPDVVLAAVYAVPDPRVGDQVMAALQLRPGATFDPAGFWAFMDGQADLGTKWMPRFVRVMDALPVTQTNKVLKRELRRVGWMTDDPVWWSPSPRTPWQPFGDDDRAALKGEFEAAGRGSALDLFGAAEPA
jgi:fatty-acyl-CoA synthase